METFAPKSVGSDAHNWSFFHVVTFSLITLFLISHSHFIQMQLVFCSHVLAKLTNIKYHENTSTFILFNFSVTLPFPIMLSFKTVANVDFVQSQCYVLQPCPPYWNFLTPMPQLHNIRTIFSLRFPIFSNWKQLWHKLYLIIYLFSTEGQLPHRILQSFVKPQHKSAVGIHISLPSWNSLPPPFPSHPSRLTQSPFFQFSETYSKFPLAMPFTHGSVCFMKQTWETSWIADAPKVFIPTLFLSLANAISAFIFCSAFAWLLHWSRPELPQWSHHLSFPSKLHPAILGVQKRKWRC